MAEAETALQQAKALRWGTYGRGAVEAYEESGKALPPIVWKPMGELDTDHLEAIFEHTQLGDDRYGRDTANIQIAVKLVLEDRKARPHQPGRHLRCFSGGFNYSISKTSTVLRPLVDR